MNEWKIKSKDDHIIQGLHYYNKDKKSQVAVIIAHGKEEHNKRYEHFSNYLVDEGYEVYTYNHRGHGPHINKSELGYLGDENGWEKVVEDTIQVIKEVKSKGYNKVFLLGHSMGSLIVRNVIQKYDEIDGVILSGTLKSAQYKTYGGCLLAKALCLIQGKRKKAALLESIAFGSSNDRFEPKRTGADWLTRDEHEVDLFVEDEYCGFQVTNQFYVDLLNGFYKLSLKRNIKKTRKDLPIYIISGDNDVVGDFGKGVTKVYNDYLNLGFQNISFKLYQEARHEILNEINKEEVYKDIVMFLEKNK